MWNEIKLMIDENFIFSVTLSVLEAGRMKNLFIYRAIAYNNSRLVSLYLSLYFMATLLNAT